MSTTRLLVVALLLPGCVALKDLKASVASTTELVARARGQHGDACAPVPLANAEADLTFVSLELEQGNANRALVHSRSAATWADEAWKLTAPCGATDLDKDGVVDVLDQCPEEAEDLDGIRDEDGCRDLDPSGDADLDGINNIDDACVDVAEDKDGDADDDGCPETSEDSDGDRLADVGDKCPDAAEDFDGFEDSDGCPDPDNDGDGVSDARDTCVNAAEDKDGFQDDDGCPDDDNDGDGIPDATDDCPTQPGSMLTRGCPRDDTDKDGVADAADQCPAEPETRNGYLDDDGCPDTLNVGTRMTSSRIELSGPLQFVPGTEDFEASAYGVLDGLARLLADAPSLRIRVEAHTEGLGDDAANLSLSQKRAAAVRDYLLSRGVDASRITAVGYGGSKPIDTNRTEAGRNANRRVEILIDR